jgi:hypothetical protein
MFDKENPANSYISVFHDGVPKVQLTGRRIVHENSWGPYIKIGNYHKYTKVPCTTQIDMDKFGIFVGPGCIEAALAHGRNL